MKGCSRQRCHVGFTTTATTATRMLLLFMLAAMVASTSSMLFQTRPNQYNHDNCLPGLSAAGLQDITVGMSNMSNIFDHLLPNVLIERVSGSQGNRIVREFIRDEMSRLGWLVEEDTFRDWTPYGVVTFSNIIATFNPAATKRVVIACHYDSKYIPGRTPFLAATDSAVPCSIMMDTARQLSQMAADASNNALNDFTLQFIFFDGEEAFVSWTARDSLYGSRHLASLWENSRDRNDPTASNNLENIEFFVLMDLIGTTDTRFVNYYSNTSDLFYRLVNIEQCLDQKKLLVRPYSRVIFDPYGRAQMVEDDHIPFIRRGVPVLHLISTPFPTVWHTVYDNLRYLDPDLIDDFSRILRLFLASLFMGV